MSTLSTQFYSSNVVDFETKRISKECWETELKNIEDSTCVHWVNQGYKVKENNTKTNTTTSAGRTRTVLWSKKYTCHRGPKVYTSKATGGQRPVQKESKKIGCPAYIMILCYISEPDTVVFERKNIHNHTPGSYEDLKFMSISENLKSKIRLFLQRGFSRRETRSCLLQELNEGSEGRDKLLRYDDVYNIWLSVAKDLYKFKENEFESLRLWEEKLVESSYKLITLFEENMFYFGFISPWQMNLMRVSKCFSLDSAFGISSRSNEVLYSLVIRHPDTDECVPLAYLITDDQSVTPVLHWLRFLKSTCYMNPDQITVDCSIPESDTIKTIFGETCRIQLCFFHVAQCWNINLTTRVKDTPGQYNNAKVVRGNIMRDLRSIMYEIVPESVVEEVNKFRERWAVEQPLFMEYFEDRWLSLDGYKKWSAAFVIQEYQNMGTNIYIESWHNILKVVYLKLMKNNRLDRLVYILTKEVENDLKLEEKRINLEIGKKGPEIKNRRETEIIAAGIPEIGMRDMINGQSKATYNLKSLTREDTHYTVTINSSGKIASCSCSCYQLESRPCKHMLLLKIYTSFEAENPSNTELPLAQIHKPSILNTSLSAPITINDNEFDSSGIKTNIKLEQDDFPHLKRSIASIKDYDFSQNINRKTKKIKDEINAYESI